MKTSSLSPWLKGLCGLAALCTAASAGAATATVDATIDMDWASLDEVAAWSWSHAFNGANAEADGIAVSDYAPPDSDPAEARIDGIAVGRASTSDTAPYARAEVRVDGVAALSASASGTSHRGRAFDAKAAGAVVFSFAYLMTEDFEMNRPGDTVGSYTIAELVLRESGVNVAYASAVRSWANGGLGLDADAPLSGLLSFTYELTEGASYYLEGHVYSAANASTSPVPLPAALPLFACALGGLALHRRTRKRGAVAAG